jgi:zinc protease
VSQGESAARGWKRSGIQPFIGGLDVHGFVFPNGLQLQVVCDSSAPVVAFQTWYSVGSADEVQGKTGLAHLFEHMMFKGTEEYADGAYSARLDALGAQGLNAWTWLDQTVYLQNIASAHLESVIEMEAARMRCLVVDETAFESELEVVTSERRLVVDNNPDGILSEQLFSLAYELHPYRSPTVGWMEDLEKLTPEDARAFYQAYYAPDNATIYVVGDITPESVAAMIHRHYGHIPPAGGSRPVRAVEPVQSRMKRSELILPLSSDRLLIGIKTPSYSHDDMPALLVLDAALTSGRTGRLQRSLRDGGWVADVSSSILPLKDPSLWEFTLQCRPGLGAADAEGIFWREIERVCTEGLGRGELEMGIAQWRAFTWSQFLGVGGKAEFLGWLATHTGSYEDGLRQIERISTVTCEEVKRVAQRWLRPERATVVVGRPEQAPSPIPLPQWEPVAPTSLVPRLQVRTQRSCSLEAGVQHEATIEGAKVMYTYDPTIPMVYFRLVVNAGAALDPRDKAGLAYLTGEMLMRGCGDLDRQGFESALEQLGANLGVSVDADGMNIWGSALVETWPSVVKLVGDALRAPVFHERELEQLKVELHDELLSIVDEDEEILSYVVRRELYGVDHPYGRDPRGSVGSVQRISVADIRSFYSRNLKCGGGLIGVVGDIDDGLLDDLRELLTGIVGTPTDTCSDYALPDLQHALVFIDKPERSQAQVCFGTVGLDQNSALFPAFVLGNDCFGGGFQSRLMQEVRVKRGWSYYAYSAPGLGRMAATWKLSLAPDNAHAVDAIQLVRELLTDACAQGFHDEEISQMRQARVNGGPFLIDTAIKRLDLAMNRERIGYDRLAVVEKIKSVPEADVCEAFGHFLQLERMVIVVVGTWSVMQKELEQAFGSRVRKLDYQMILDEVK